MNNSSQWVPDLSASTQMKYLGAFIISIMSIFIIVVTATSPTYSKGAMLFPLVIGIVTAIFLGIAVGRNAINARNSNNSIFSDASSEGDDIFLPIAILLVVTVLVIVLGFHLGGLIFLIYFYRSQAELTWKRTIVSSVIFWALVIIVFEMILGLRLYEGVFGFLY